MRTRITALGLSVALGVASLIGPGIGTSRAHEPDGAKADEPIVSAPEHPGSTPSLDAVATVTPNDPLTDIKLTQVSVNWAGVLIGTVWFLMLLLPGFALRDAGSISGTSVRRMAGRNLVICVCATIGYWICGFALMGGGIETIPDGPAVPDRMIAIKLGGTSFGIVGFKGFFLTGAFDDALVLMMFLFQAYFMLMSSLIPSGMLSSRTGLVSLCVYGLFFAMVFYPVYGAWVWGGGWLADLGLNFGLGNGHVDFAGASVVQMTGGMVALAGAWALGPRSGRPCVDASTSVVPRRNRLKVLLGSLLLLTFWATIEPAVGGAVAPRAGSTLAASDGAVIESPFFRFSVMLLAAVLGGLASILGRWAVTRKLDLATGCNGLLGGVVATQASLVFVNPLGAAMIGAVAGLTVVGAAWLVERALKLDDPAQAISVYGACGAWGCLSLGLFATGKNGAGWNGVANLAPTGLLYGGGAGQLAAQAIGVLANALFVIPLASVFFVILAKTSGTRLSQSVT